MMRLAWASNPGSPDHRSQAARTATLPTAPPRQLVLLHFVVLYVVRFFVRFVDERYGLKSGGKGRGGMVGRGQGGRG